MGSEKRLDVRDVEVAEMAHKKFAEIEAQEAKEAKEAKSATTSDGEAPPEPEKAPEKVDEPKPATEEKVPEKPESDNGPADAEREPEKPTKAEAKAAEKRVFKALLGGRLQDVNEDDLVKLAQVGYTAQEIVRAAEAERAQIAEQGKKLGALMEKIRPHKERLDRMEQEEREKEALDPSIGLKREQDALRQRVEAWEQSQRQQAQQSQQRAQIDDFNARVQAARNKHEAFKVIEADPELNRRITEGIYGAIARGAPIEDAVAKEVEFYSGILAKAKSAQKIEGIKRATDRARLPSVPGKGVGPTTPERSLTRKSLYNGDAVRVAMERFQPKE